ncbi:HDIG domain protein [Olavius algarvensis Delta 1 endosymbiont]|nr:HDIG domain protein [Olavius algarvensis Delta 1 endosymbiont]
MDPLEILAEFYDRNSRAFEILVAHGRQVAQKALVAAQKVAHLQPDLDFIHNAALLHDIGILHTASPGFGCHGKYPYICHGYLGRELLDGIGLPQYGLISERHIGAGISRDDIRKFKLPLPQRDMVPVSIEEQIICYADKFFSKNGQGRQPNGENSVEQITQSLRAHGQEQVTRFQEWVNLFGD